MRLIVDEMPKDTLDCPFRRVIEMYWNSQVMERTCKLTDGGSCELKDGKCPWLKVLYEDVEQAEDFGETYQKLLGNTYCTDAMKELLEWISPTTETGYSND